MIHHAVAGAVLCLAALAPPALAAPGDIYDLGSLSAGGTEGHDVNDAGQVTGTSLAANPISHAFRYDGTPGAGGVMRDLGAIVGVSGESQGWAINNAGQVAGQGDTGTTTSGYHAFRYDGTPGSGGVMRDLGTLGQGPSYGYGINDTGQVAGASYTASTARHAFRYDSTPGSGGVMRDLGSLGGNTSEGRAVNNAGQVAGHSYLTGHTVEHAFRYDGTPGAGGVMRDLGTLGGANSYGWDINTAGQVAGRSDTDLGGTHAFRYDGTPGSGGVMRDLGTLGGTYSNGLGINDAGQVVGSSLAADNSNLAFLYTGTPDAGGQMIDLDAWLDANNPAAGAKWTLIQAFAISNTGWVTGEGLYDPDGPSGVIPYNSTFLLDASALVPEPAGLALLSLAGALSLRRRRGTRASF